jgi:hypothetical protein
MPNQKQQVRVNLKFIDVDERGKVIINNPRLSEAIKKAKESGIQYVFLDAETGDFCVAKSQPCA